MATVLLSLATLVGARSAYRCMRYSGAQALNTTTAAARRIEVTRQKAIYTPQVRLDVIGWITCLEHLQEGDEKGPRFSRSALCGVANV